MFVLDRENDSAFKIMTKVDAPKVLDLRNPGSEEPVLYELVAVINHHGFFSDCGHYTTYARRAHPQTAEQTWFHFNDEKVRELQTQLITPAAFMFTYRRL